MILFVSHLLQAMFLFTEDVVHKFYSFISFLEFEF